LRVKDTSTRDTIQAWRVVQIWVKTQNDKRMPSLASLLEQDAKPKIQSREEQFEAIKMLSQMYGGKIVELKRSA
jgi:hypothetical protein